MNTEWMSVIVLGELRLAEGEKLVSNEEDDLNSKKDSVMFWVLKMKRKTLPSVMVTL